MDEMELSKLWKSELPKIFANIRLALSTGKVDSVASGAALAGPLSQELSATCEAIDAGAADRLKTIFDQCYAEIEAMNKTSVEEVIA
jgi:hypothetical protein